MTCLGRCVVLGTGVESSPGPGPWGLVDGDVVACSGTSSVRARRSNKRESKTRQTAFRRSWIWSTELMDLAGQGPLVLPSLPLVHPSSSSLLVQ